MDFNSTASIGILFPDLPRLKINEERVSIWEANNPFTPRFPVKDKVSFLGIEVETENVTAFTDTGSPFWTMIEDGSLRNGGKEFISSPTRAYRTEQALTTLFSQQLNKDIDFSDRTSIHVHLNVRTLTQKQLMSLVLCYMVFEKTLFNWVGHERYQSIFCSPLINIPDIEHLYSQLVELRHGINWNKYSALNLQPITSKGTIEFRHLYGTKEIPIIMFWINIILSLKKYALKTDPDKVLNQIKDLNTSSQYTVFAQEIFGDQAEELANYKEFEKDCYYCITIVKEQLLEDAFDKSVKQYNENSVFYKMVEKFSRQRTPKVAKVHFNEAWLNVEPTPRPRNIQTTARTTQGRLDELQVTEPQQEANPFTEERANEAFQQLTPDEIRNMINRTQPAAPTTQEIINRLRNTNRTGGR